eukprot:7182899-Pyramimonas_sp.AAC.1
MQCDMRGLRGRQCPKPRAPGRAHCELCASRTQHDARIITETLPDALSREKSALRKAQAQ